MFCRYNAAKIIPRLSSWSVLVQPDICFTNNFSQIGESEMTKEDQLDGTRLLRALTQLKHAEEELHRSEERYRAVVEQTADAIFLVDVFSKRILEFNPRFEELLGYPSNELDEMTLYDLAPHDREGVEYNTQHILEE